MDQKPARILHEELQSKEIMHGVSDRIAHSGDFHVDEDHYFGDTAQCMEWFIQDAIAQNVDLFVLNGDLTTYKETIKERNFLDRQVDQHG